MPIVDKNVLKNLLNKLLEKNLERLEGRSKEQINDLKITKMNMKNNKNY